MFISISSRTPPPPGHHGPPPPPGSVGARTSPTYPLSSSRSRFLPRCSPCSPCCQEEGGEARAALAIRSSALLSECPSSRAPSAPPPRCCIRGGVVWWFAKLPVEGAEGGGCERAEEELGARGSSNVAGASLGASAHAFSVPRGV
eukprot:3507572-Rhodomonas_salina.2